MVAGDRARGGTSYTKLESQRAHEEGGCLCPPPTTHRGHLAQTQSPAGIVLRHLLSVTLGDRSEVIEVIELKCSGPGLPGGSVGLTQSVSDS